MISASSPVEPGFAAARAAQALAMHVSAPRPQGRRTTNPSTPAIAGAGRRHWSAKYPPVFRGISPAQSSTVSFEHLGGVSHLNPVRIEHQTRVDFSWMKNWEPCAISVLSGLPSFVYNTAEVRIPLTRSEIGRLLRFSLSRGEYVRLVEKYGVFFEICDFFYNEETGDALCPMRGVDLAERQRHTQILSLVPGAVPLPEGSTLPEDIAAYLKGERLTADAGAATLVKDDPRPYLLALANDDGTVRPHSIMGQAAAYAFRDEVKEQIDTTVLTLPLLGPVGAWRPDPFDNFVVLYSKKDGSFEAYGRFASRKDANKFTAKPPAHLEGVEFSVASVTSSYLGVPTPETPT